MHLQKLLSCIFLINASALAAPSLAGQDWYSLSPMLDRREPTQNGATSPVGKPDSSQGTSAGTSPTKDKSSGPVGSLSFTTKDNVKVVSGADLNKYTASFDTQVSGQKCPQHITQKFDAGTQYVYMGVHVTAATMAPEGFPNAGAGGASSGATKMNGILKSGLRAGKSNPVLLYGPGVYTTQRPPIGYIAGSSFKIFGLSPEKEKELYEKYDWAVYMLHLFLPLSDYKTLHKQQVPLIRDVTNPFPKAIADAQTKAGLRHGEGKSAVVESDRTKWGLKDTDVVVASPDELIFSQQIASKFKMFGETVANKQEWKKYFDWRVVERPKVKEGEPWAKTAIPALNKIPNPPIYSSIKANVADLTHLPKKTDKGSPYWDVFSTQPKRDYKKKRSLQMRALLEDRIARRSMYRRR